MPLQNYGLLTGKIIALAEQHGGNPHYLLTVQAGSIAYRVSVNLESTPGDDTAVLQYQIVPNLAKSNAKAKALAAAIQNQNRFELASQGSPTLDFVHGGVLKMPSFQTITAGTKSPRNAYYSAFIKAVHTSQADAGAFVAVFGTGYSQANSTAGKTSAFGFSGVENVHMNQGSFLEVGTHTNGNYQENGPDQDGAVLFFGSDGIVQGFFSKFTSQDNDTDAFGNPQQTNVDQLNATPAPVKKSLTASVAKRKKTAAAMIAATPATPAKTSAKTAKTKKSTPATSGFVFNDPPDSPDPVQPFKPDDDSGVDATFVNKFAKNGVPEVVPGPRGGQYPVLKLATIVGADTVNAIQQSGQIVIHTAGDTGSPTAAKLPNETGVANLMLKDFQSAAAQPAFFYHLGDVVYYFGEQDYYYDQFYKPYREYPRPIFAIPGNHDGITYTDAMQSLGPFIKAFCDPSPDHWKAAGGISRTTMTQPGVYFTLDAPFVSIIGLYSNCSESYGYLDAQQTLFLYNELVRLKPLRESGAVAAVLLAVHHPPMSYSPSKPSSQALRNDLDNACQKADFWPDAVFSGHAHVYQRMTRTIAADGGERAIPHLVCGAGGYAINALQEVDKTDMQALDTSDPEFQLHQFLRHYGFLRLTITPTRAGKNGTLRMEFLSPAINAGASPADTCVLDLETHQLL